MPVTKPKGKKCPRCRGTGVKSGTDIAVGKWYMPAQKCRRCHGTGTINA